MRMSIFRAGPFLSGLLKKLQTFTSNGLYVNLQLTGLMTRLAWYPLPLIHSILLRPDIPTTSDTPSFHQVLKILKQQIDAELPVSEESLEYIDAERTNLIERECRLVNARKMESETSPIQGNINYQSSSTSNMSATTPPQLTPSSSYDPFRRTETKKKSITNSFTNIFRRSSNSGSNMSSGKLPFARHCMPSSHFVGTLQHNTEALGARHSCIISREFRFFSLSY